MQGWGHNGSQGFTTGASPLPKSDTGPGAPGPETLCAVTINMSCRKVNEMITKRLKTDTREAKKKNYKEI